MLFEKPKMPRAWLRLRIDKRRDASSPRLINPRGSVGIVAMPINDALGSRPADRSDWSNAWEAVSRLAAAREAALHEIGRDRRGASAPDLTRGSKSIPGTLAKRDVSTNEGMDPDQLAIAVAEIENASAALRRSEPTLEIWSPNSAKGGEKRQYLSVWILIGGIWISATLVVAGATGAILYVLG